MPHTEEPRRSPVDRHVQFWWLCCNPLWCGIVLPSCATWCLCAWMSIFWSALVYRWFKSAVVRRCKSGDDWNNSYSIFGGNSADLPFDQVSVVYRVLGAEGGVSEYSRESCNGSFELVWPKLRSRRRPW